MNCRLQIADLRSQIDRSIPAPGLVIAAALVFAYPAAAAQQAFTSPEAREHTAAMAAHHLCSGVFVVGRDYRRTPEQVLAEDIAQFPVFNWQYDLEYQVDQEQRTASRTKVEAR